MTPYRKILHLAGAARTLLRERQPGTPDDLAPAATNTGALEALDAPGDPGRDAARALGDSFRLQLQLLREALGLSGVALLWPDAAGGSLRLREIVTVRRDLRSGPYPMGSGVTGVLAKGRDEVAMAPVPKNYAPLPYYAGKAPGSLFAVRVAVDGDSAPGGILCADRATGEPWREAELETLRLAARRLAFDIALGRRYLAMDRERTLFRRACGGLRALTDGLGLEASLDATLQAVQTLVAADLVAVVLVEGQTCRTVRAVGQQAGQLPGTEFALEEGLIGQALRYDAPLPEGGEARPGVPVFGSKRLGAELRSLLVLPLRRERDKPLGALVVAARAAGAFGGRRRELLELVATQAAVKIDLARAHEQISRLATTDSLTGLANHRAFQQAFRAMLERARRMRTPVTLVLCDVDHFKSVNDNYGHPFGDTVLKAVGAALARSVRAVDLAARYGGEEFALLLEDADRKGALQLAERVRRTVEALALRHDERPVRVTISLGLATFPGDGGDIPELIERADQALYRAKEGGRNRVIAWTGRGD